ncbi:MAG: hypothetical protein J6252_00385, partial [Clostridia bacterium]|nr:hypothetical protein [Clostridia bacterium]
SKKLFISAARSPSPLKYLFLLSFLALFISKGINEYLFCTLSYSRTLYFFVVVRFSMSAPTAFRRSACLYYHISPALSSTFFQFFKKIFRGSFCPGKALNLPGFSQAIIRPAPGKTAFWGVKVHILTDLL